jgi:hypothetical protein
MIEGNDSRTLKKFATAAEVDLVRAHSPQRRLLHAVPPGAGFPPDGIRDAA